MRFLKSLTIENDQAIINTNLELIDNCILLTKNNLSVRANLDKVRENFCQMVATDEKACIKCDKKISKALTKLKKVIVKECIEGYFFKSKKIINVIEILMIERGFFDIIIDEQDYNDFVIKENVLIKYLGKNEKVVVPCDIVAIGEKAFYACENITEIIINNGCQSIGEHAFDQCINLYKVNMPYTLTEIGASAFHNCKQLSMVILPDNLLEIGHYGFARCNNLKSLKIPESLCKIGQHAFCYNYELNKKTKNIIKKINKDALK